ncbi:MAG: sn-glycerol-3-phosphate import ATP-binding protein UgpC [Desulfobacterales bacterium]|nr:sn-glycerol-3-phosphate import ATP-binding protein UgpC [Desulfobacterales bacterium]
MAAVSLGNVTKSFGKNEVIHGISCDIDDGEFIVILGPSGCGKSTLLRMIAGLEKITGGEVAIDGRVVNTMEPSERDVAMVFQNYALYPHMSVYNNMAYGLKIRRMPKDEIRKRVLNAAEILELTAFLERKPRQLSGGQRQRVAMGRCIVREPKVFLFDEPLSNLDAKLRVQMRLEIRKLHEELRITSVYVTHDQVEAMTLGDRLIVMDDGRAVQIGSPLEVYSRPATRFVAGFIGSPAMNFLEARVSADGRQVTIADGKNLSLAGPAPAEVRNRDVILGIRPEHFEVVDAGAVTISLIVDHVEILGADTLVYGRLNDASVELTVRLPDVHHFQTAAALSLVVPPDRLHLFDPRSGARIEV